MSDEVSDAAAEKPVKSPRKINPEKLDFETALSQLEAIVREMESGKLPLETMLNRFELASALASACRKKLDSVSQRIEILTAGTADAPVFTEFDPVNHRVGAEGSAEE